MEIQDTQQGVGWTQVSSKRPRGNQQQQGENNYVQVIPVRNPIIIIEFLHSARNLVFDQETRTRLLNTSPFKGKFVGTGEVRSYKFELFLEIKNINLIPDLLNVDHLMEGPIKHQIKCCSPTNAQSVDHTYGTLRDMHPSISVERVMANLSIDNENNRRIGVTI